MKEKDVSCVGVVDKEGKLVNNLSASDLRVCFLLIYIPLFSFSFSLSLSYTHTHTPHPTYPHTHLFIGPHGKGLW